MSQYEYARDNRSDEQYEKHFFVGTQINQGLAMEQLRIDRFIENGTTFNYRLNPDKTFQREDGMWIYNPDYVVELDNKEVPCEVKVQMTELGDTIDLKCSQIYRLCELRGAVLYATKRNYTLVFAKKLKQLGSVIESERFGGKKVFQVDVDALDWILWLHYPDFQSYR